MCICICIIYLQKIINIKIKCIIIIIHIMELLRDPKVEQQFQKLVTKFLSKNDNYDMKKFIGGLPVILERGDVSQLMTKGPNGIFTSIDMEV